MKLHDDGDLIKALGFVALHSAYLEDELEELTGLISQHHSMHKNIQSFRASDMARHLRKTIKDWFDEVQENYPVNYGQQEITRAQKMLRRVEAVAKIRNDVLHSPIFGDDHGGAAQKSKHHGNRKITSKYVYTLAECINNLSAQVYGLQFVVGRLCQASEKKQMSFSPALGSEPPANENLHQRFLGRQG